MKETYFKMFSFCKDIMRKEKILNILKITIEEAAINRLFERNLIELHRRNFFRKHLKFLQQFFFKKKAMKGYLAFLSTTAGYI